MTATGGAIMERFSEILVPVGPLSDLGEVVLGPRSTDEVAEIIRSSMDGGLSVSVAGSASSHNGTTTRRSDVVISTVGLDSVVAYEPDDLTLVVGAGTTLGTVASVLADRHQTAVLVEGSPDRTVGGVVAAGDSGFRRLLYGPTRDRVLGIEMVTGYGEVVRGGGRLVKNVTGYDLPRLVVGSMGSLGVLTEVCVKLWPEPPVKVSVPIGDPHAILERMYKPSAVLETEAGSTLYLEGSESSVGELLASVGGDVEAGHRWPEPLTGPFQLSLRLPPKSLAVAVAEVRTAGASRFIAQHGVGRLDAAWDGDRVPDIEALRSLSVTLGGFVAITAWDGQPAPNRWGRAPDGMAIQQRLLDLFDPGHVFVSASDWAP